MKLLIVADGRNRNTQGWIKALQTRPELEIHLVSSYEAEPIEGLASQHTIPLAFSRFGGASRVIAKSATKEKKQSPWKSLFYKLLARFRKPLMSLRYWLGPMSLKASARQLNKLVSQIQPDLIHALRIPFEGMLCGAAHLKTPFVVSTWGNDFTLHAQGSPLMRQATCNTLRACSGMMADAHRDLELARGYDLAPSTPSQYAPGGGGITFEALPSAALTLSELLNESLDEHRPVVVNPRGFRPGSVRNDTFFKAIPKVLREMPDVLFICLAMAGEPIAENWTRELSIAPNVRLLPLLTQQQVWGLFKRAEIMTSISEHDGTPNSMLEAMACGSYPIAGDIPSVAEWITDHKNGRLIDPLDDQALAAAIIDALKAPSLRQQAAQHNLKIIQSRAARQVVAAESLAFYKKVIAQSASITPK